MAWCALVALALARRDGRVSSRAQENLFLTRWLATALKQHLFPRVLATDLEWLLNQGRQLGLHANLVTKLTYLWESCTGQYKAQNDRIRLTHAIETAKDMHWICQILNEHEWSGRHAVALNTAVYGVYLSTGNFDAAFDHDGHQVGVLLANITGDVDGFGALLDRFDWRLEHQSEYRYHLWASKNDE
ncbi:DUF2913 family protein [Citrobacter amalonaticus]|nr:DUF2913 family protein [Citrobacter amalonaticus]